jgi:hypothetical protein
MWSMHCEVELGYQLSISWSSSTVAGPSGCKLTSIQQSGIKYASPNISTYLCCFSFFFFLSYFFFFENIDKSFYKHFEVEVSMPWCRAHSGRFSPEIKRALGRNWMSVRSFPLMVKQLDTDPNNSAPSNTGENNVWSFACILHTSLQYAA